MHPASYLSKLYIDHVSLGGCGQACAGMPKEALKTFNISKTNGGIKLILGMQFHIY